MSNINIESLKWIDDLARVTAQAEKTPDASHTELAEILNIPTRSSVTFLLAIGACFDQTALEKVRQAGKANPPYIFSLRNAQALSRLKDRVSDPFGAVNAALDVALPQKLDTKHIKALVEWIIAGKPAAEFKLKTKTTKPPRTSKPKSTPTPPLPMVDDKLAQLFKQVEQSTGEDKIKAQEQVVAYVASQSPSPKKASGISSSTGTQETKEDAPKTVRGKKSQSDNPSLFWEWVVGIKFISQFRSKVKKGEKLSNTEKLFLLVYKFLEFMGWLGKPFGKILKKIFEGLWHALKKAFGKTFSKILDIVLPILILCALLWLGWKIIQYGVAYPLHWIESKVESVFHHANAASPSPNSGTSQETGTQPAPVQEAPPIRSAHPHPMIPYQPKTSAWTTADETQDYLDQELFPVSKDSVIKTHTFEPDTAMGSDMAYHLVMDLQSPDKYTVFCGRDKAAVKTITTGASQITLTMQIGLLSPLTGSSTFNFYWADLKQLHCDVIESGLAKRFQCSLVLAESKKPLTIQCDSAVDLERLVSALEFYIRLSGHNAAPITGLPYLSQGVRLDKDGEITTLWADSPIAKAGLVLGDVPWSVGTKTDHPQNKAVLEAGLQSLASGSNDLYYVTADGWKRALKASDPNDPDSFRPLRRKVSLRIE